MVEFPLMGKETKSQPKVDILSKSKGKKKKKSKGSRILEVGYPKLCSEWI